MSAGRRDDERILRLRSAVARAHLAASELRREVVTPRGSRLVERIWQAAAEIDARLEDSGEVETPTERAVHGTETVAAAATVEPVSAVGRLHARLAPVVARRGVEWCVSEIPDQAGSGSTAVDASLLRHATCELVQLAAEWAGSGGRLRTLVDETRTHWGLGFAIEVCADARRPDASGGRGGSTGANGSRGPAGARGVDDPDDTWRDLAHRLAREGGSLDIERDAHRVWVRLRRQENPCVAS